MEKITLYNRKKKTFTEEKIYFKNVIEFLYSNNFFSKILVNVFSKFSFFSKFIGFLNDLKLSKCKIKSFVKHFNINIDDYEKSIDEFTSFNDFFIRKLKKNSRVINNDPNRLIFPCDGKFLAYQDVSSFDSFFLKNQKFSLREFLQDDSLLNVYKNGSMLICRLAPDDYHRFHFPCDCIPNKSRLINGFLFSVNPIALKKNIKIFYENKRMLTTLHTKNFSDVLYIEIGATNVGSINQSYIANLEYKKADEKGYFSLGASCIVLLFKKNTILFDKDLLQMSKDQIETSSLLGDSFATKF
jgi:phosphatidylserine decarboxylase